jgi:hypothetical protein
MAEQLRVLYGTAHKRRSANHTSEAYRLDARVDPLVPVESIPSPDKMDPESGNFLPCQFLLTTPPSCETTTAVEAIPSPVS